MASIFLAVAVMRLTPRLGEPDNVQHNFAGRTKLKQLDRESPYLLDSFPLFPTGNFSDCANLGADPATNPDCPGLSDRACIRAVLHLSFETQPDSNLSHLPCAQ